MHCRGFTLIELVCVLAVGTVLVYLAHPPYEGLVERLRTTSRVNGLIGLVRFARTTAVTERVWITLCPTSGTRCSNNRAWESGIMAFVDLNRDGNRQPGERMVAFQEAFKPGERLVWRSFRQRNFLQFRSEGYTNWQNGSFLYCPASGDSRHGKVLIINIQGRTTPSVDSDGDGIDEQASGEPLAC